MITITPTLFMGPRMAASARPNLIPVEDASDAYTAIRSGHKALLAEGEWVMAAETLRKLGLTDERIAHVLRQAGR
jgi:hypothetical protein